MKKNKILIFDFDGVIVNSAQLSLEINQEMFSDLQFSDIQRWAEGNIYSQKLREDYDEVRCGEYYFSQYSERVVALVPVEGIDKVLKRINKELGYKVIIVSSTNESSVNGFLEKYELKKYFLEVWGIETSKSKSEKFKKFFEKYKIKAEETIMVTDTVGDIKEAKEVGVKTIGTVWGVHEKERLIKNGVDFVAERPEDIILGIKKILALN